jgi:hypothetical protein
MDVFTKMDNQIVELDHGFLGHFDILICGMYFDGTTWDIRNTEHLLGISGARRYEGVYRCMNRYYKYIDRGITLYMQY